MSETNTHVTISMSSTPRRVDKILPTLETLLEQTKPADTILVNIPKYCQRLDQRLEEIPDFLIDLEKTTHVKIQITDDYGPATKFIPAWQSIEPSEDHFLIWLDDDIKYANTLVEELVRCCPIKSAIAAAGFKLMKNQHKMELRHLNEVDIVEGWGGVCCRTSDIPDLNKIWSLKSYDEMTFIEKCYWHSDDYVMSRALQDNGIKTVVCCTERFNRFMNKPFDYGLQDDALQNSKTTKGHGAAYAALEKERSFHKIISLIKSKQKRE